MFSPTIMLLIGGFTISSALSKTNIDRVIFTRVLYYAGTKPKSVILAFMFVSCFASMLIRYASGMKSSERTTLTHSGSLTTVTLPPLPYASL